MPTETPRDTALDGLRGLNAFIVVTWHVYCLLAPFITITTVLIVQTFPLSFFLSGTQAVVCFFILSGFVLTQTTKNINFSWKEYYPKRIIRLYIPTAIAFVFAASLILLIPRKFPTLENGTWLTTANYETITWETLFNNLTLFTTTLNNPTWSIVYEIIFSLTLPLWLIVFKQISFRVASLTTIALLLASWYGIKISNEPLTWFPVFGIGILMSLHIRKIKEFTTKILQSKYKILYILSLTSASILLFSLPGEHGTSTRFLTIIGATLLTFATLTIPIIQKPLRTKVFQFLGKISFSLYLVHVPIIVTVYLLLPPETGLYSFILSIPLSIIVATIFTYVIDKPSIKFSHKIGRIFKKQLHLQENL